MRRREIPRGLAAVVLRCLAKAPTGRPQSYGLVVADGNGGGNYAITYVDNTTGVITAAPLTVTAQTDSRGYDGSTASAVGPVVSGTLYDAVGTSATQVYDDRNAGTGKTLSASGLVVADGNGGGNYAITYVDNTTGVITAAPLTVTADDVSRLVNTPNPPFSASYAGFVGGDSAGSLGGTLIFSTPAVVASPSGVYAINVSGQTSSNYTLPYAPGRLTVFDVPPSPIPPVFGNTSVINAINPQRNVQDLLLSIGAVSGQAPRGDDDPTLSCGALGPIGAFSCNGGGRP
jgi:hypothetical protein